VLTQGTVTYTGLGVEITLLNLEDRSKLGSAIQALSSVIGNSKLPIPTSPYTEGLSYVLQFANTAIDNDIKNHNQDDKFKSGALDFNFDPDGACNGDFEKTGTKAIVFSAGPQAKDDSYIDISKTGDYCWSADLTPSFVLKAVHMDGGKPCSDPSYQGTAKPISNSYIGFYLNKRTLGRTLGPDSAAERDRQEALARCSANGITDAAKCPGGALK
jgi:hypothetical protein